jgi:hypothetical protein
VHIDEVAVHQRHPGFDAFWETMLDLSRELHDVVLARPDAEIAEIRTAVAARLASHMSADGAVEIPGRSLVAAARA